MYRFEDLRLCGTDMKTPKDAYKTKGANDDGITER